MKWENQRLLLDQASRMETISRGVEQLKLDIPQERARNLASEYDHVLFSVEYQQGDQTQKSDIPMLSDQVKAHVDQLREINEIEQDVKKAQAILTSLDFEFRQGRYEAIPEAYSATYEWAFNSDLSHWLQYENGIFWVSGKAGSGKSTLMKFIATHCKTQNFLLDWSSQKPIAIASHYFWAAGALIQKSRTGLLRTLLYEIFRQCPKYIPIVCPDRWNLAKNQSSKLDAGLDGTGKWSHLELSQALRRLASLGDLETRFCFFIDGLDEYNEYHLDLCDILKEFSTSPHNKLCVSSRPWNVFIDNFGGDKKRMLKVHELTATDILTFSLGRLESHPRWAAYRSRDTYMHSIAQTISNRAEGVFLWAFLVTKSLQDGLTNGDTAQQLRQRLDNLPNSLKRLFKYMLDQVDPCYHEKMAGMFQTALYAQEPLRLDLYGFLDREYEDNDYAIHCLVKERSIGERLDLYDETRRRINTWANGLLECDEHSYKVDFLHRTVRDFLRTGDMLSYLEGKRRPEIDVYLSIVKAYVAYIKSTRFNDGILRMAPPGHNSGILIDRLATTLEHASQVSEEESEKLAELLDELECAFEEMFQTKQASFRLEAGEPKLVFREEVLRSNAAPYVAKKLADIPDYLSKSQLAPLSVAVTAEVPQPDTIRILLQHGEDTNSVSRVSGNASMSPWVHLCFIASPWSFTGLGEEVLSDSLDRRLHRLFLSYGADPNSTMSGCNFTVFAMYLMTIFCTPGYIKRPDEYISTLETFLTAGADLGAKMYFNNSNLRLSSLVRWWPNDGGVSTVFDASLDGLHAWAKTDGMRQANSRFMSKVIGAILVHKKTPKQYVDHLASILLQVFSEHIARPLLRAISDSPGNCQDFGEKQKRKQSGTDDTSDYTKRFKKGSTG